MTFFPSLLFITISYATSFFKLPNFFNTAITVNITLMLTTTTLLISVVKKLAQTSYVKWIEAWLIFAMLIPFIQVILITYIEWLREEKNKEDMDKTDKEREKEYLRSNDLLWLDVANKLVKVRKTKINKQHCLISIRCIHWFQKKLPRKKSRWMSRSSSRRLVRAQSRLYTFLSLFLQRN